MYMSAHEHTCAEIRKDRETERQIECKGRAYICFILTCIFICTRNLNDANQPTYQPTRPNGGARCNLHFWQRRRWHQMQRPRPPDCSKHVHRTCAASRFWCERQSSCIDVGAWKPWPRNSAGVDGCSCAGGRSTIR